MLELIWKTQRTWQFMIPWKVYFVDQTLMLFFRRHHYRNSSSKLTIAVLLEIFDLQAKKKKRTKKQTFYNSWRNMKKKLKPAFFGVADKRWHYTLGIATSMHDRHLVCSRMTDWSQELLLLFFLKPAFFGVADKSWHYTLGIATSMHDRHLVCSRMTDWSQELLFLFFLLF